LIRKLTVMMAWSAMIDASRDLPADAPEIEEAEQPHDQWPVTGVTVGVNR
jgi:hypothetical protein